MKYKVGDIVYVKKDLRPGSIYFSKEYVGTTLFFAHEMKAFCGKIGKVIEIFKYNGLHPERYRLSFSPDNWVFSNEMLAPCDKNTVRYYLEERSKNAV